MYDYKLLTSINFTYKLGKSTDMYTRQDHKEKFLSSIFTSMESIVSCFILRETRSLKK